MKDIPENVKNCARSIGEFYLDKYLVNAIDKKDYDKAYADAHKDIQTLGIKTIEIIDKNIVITLSRPGLLIGVKGTNIEALGKYLHNDKFKIDFEKIHIIEDNLDLYLYPFDPNFEDDYDDDYDGEDFTDEDCF